MKVTFLGVGEACDERQPNTSVWVQTMAGREPRSILLDCGFTVPPRYFSRMGTPEDLDGLWISHFHGDHFFGVPILLLRLWETSRTKPLTVIGQEGVEELIHGVMELAYPNFLRKLAFPLEFVTAEPGRTLHAVGYTWRFAENGHGQRDLAVRIEDGERSVFYSGDGRPTSQTLELARGCDLIIQEAFHLDSPVEGHGTVAHAIEFGRLAGASALALVHLQRDVRHERSGEVLALAEQVQELRVLLPESGDEMDL